MFVRTAARSLIGLMLLLWASAAVGQSAPNPVFTYGFVPTPAQWNSFFQAKQDALGFSAVNKNGDTMLGELLLPASTFANAPLNIPQGTGPTTPKNGDIWVTSFGVSAQINGQTVTLGTIGGLNPGGSNNAIQYNANGAFGGFTLNGDCTVSLPSGLLTCTKSNGSVFGSAAFQNLAYPIAANLGGTGVNNGSFTLSTLENVSFTGGFALQFNVGGIATAIVPSGTHTLASLDAANQSATGGATVPTGNFQIPTGNFTVNCGNGPFQWQLNAGNWTITAPSSADQGCDILVINAANSSTAIGTPTLNIAAGWAPKAGTGFAFSNTPTASAVAVTWTQANPGVVTWTAHGLGCNSPVWFNTSATMPSPISAFTIYYVVCSSITTNTFSVAATPNGAAIQTTSTGSSVTGTAPSVWKLSVQTVNGIANYNWLQLQ